MRTFQLTLILIQARIQSQGTVAAAAQAALEGRMSTATMESVLSAVAQTIITTITITTITITMEED